VLDWRVSPQGIAGPQGQNSRNSGSKCRLARFRMVPNFVTVRQEVCCEISAVENFCSRKSGRRFTKIPQDLLHAPMPVITQNFIALRQTMYEKNVSIFSVFWRPWVNSWAELHQSQHWCVARPGLPMCQISFPSDNLSTGYLLPNCADFVKSVTDRQTSSKQYVSAYHAATKKRFNWAGLRWPETSINTS